jgi:hypothetical protein
MTLVGLVNHRLMEIKSKDIGVVQTAVSIESGDLKMPRNIGTLDQVIRAMLGLALIAYVGKDGTLAPDSSLAVLAGIYLLATGIFLRCPLYRVLGFTTFGRLDRSV